MLVFVVLGAGHARADDRAQIRSRLIEAINKRDTRVVEALVTLPLHAEKLRFSTESCRKFWGVSVLVRTSELGAFIDCLASDNHGDRRSLAAARVWLEELGADEHAQMLTHVNAARVLANESTIPVPPLPLARGMFSRLRELLLGRR